MVFLEERADQPNDNADSDHHKDNRTKRRREKRHKILRNNPDEDDCNDCLNDHFFAEHSSIYYLDSAHVFPHALGRRAD